MRENAADFVKAAAASDRFEVESSKLAVTAAQSAAVKSFAAQMVEAHTASTAKLKTVVDSVSPTLPMNDGLNPEQQGLLDGLRARPAPSSMVLKPRPRSLRTRRP